MASARAMIERRRSSRVFTRIPVKVLHPHPEGEPVHTPCEAIAVSRCGALIRAPFSADLGDRIQVLNDHSQEIREFRVIRVTNAREKGFYHLGLEILHPARNFWDVKFPDERY